MVVSLRLKDAYNVVANNNNNLLLDGKMVALKDIPFMRYNFASYEQKHIDYISSMMNRYKLSTHLIEFSLKDIASVINMLRVSGIENNIAKYAYVGINEENMSDINGYINSFSYIKEFLVSNSIYLDRMVIEDNTSTLDIVTAKEVINGIKKVTGVDSVGLCNSPLCLGSEYSCLTAIKARELMAKYCSSTETTLPSANHQCMDCCGCIRHINIADNIITPNNTKVIEEKEKKVKAKSNSDEAKEKKEKAPKQVKRVATMSRFI